MPEFANIKYFTPIKNGAYDFKTVPAAEFRLDKEGYKRGSFIIYPLYDDMTIGNPVTTDEDYTIPTGTYVTMFNFDTWPGDVIYVISCVKRKNYSGRRRHGEPMYSNYGINVLTWDPTISGRDLIAAYHPPACPIFAGTKRVSGIWIKQGQQIVKPSGVYVKQDGAIKKK